MQEWYKSKPPSRLAQSLVRRRKNAKQESENDDQRNPFAELLAEVGIERSSLPSLTNGELMRICETDLITYHGWMYLNRPLPEEARDKLKKHFIAIVSGASES
jgi:ABC-type phosphate/phosphonate transport system substrate-binding protein